jgi:hypothetical protein
MDEDRIIVLCDSKGCVIEAYSLVCKHRALAMAAKIEGYIVDVPFNPHLASVDDKLEP